VAEIAGSVGLAGSANVGKDIAMFEAIHGSAPDIAGQNIANPSGLINAAVMMLAHIGQPKVADKVKNAWLATIEDGMHTADIYQDGWSKKKVSCSQFAQEVIARLGQLPQSLSSSQLSVGTGSITIPEYNRPQSEKVLVGTDVFVDWQGSNPDTIGNMLSTLPDSGLKLKMITNRGVKVYPEGQKHTYCTDHWRCRFVSTAADIKATPPDYKSIKQSDVLSLLTTLLPFAVGHKIKKAYICTPFSKLEL